MTPVNQTSQQHRQQTRQLSIKYHNSVGRISAADATSVNKTSQVNNARRTQKYMFSMNHFDKLGSNL